MPALTFPRSTLGAILEVTIGPSAKTAVQAAATGKLLLPPAKVLMLVDTGAQRTVIDEDLIDGWGLVYVSAGWAATINGTKPIKSYEMHLALGSPGAAVHWTIDPLVMMARRSPFKGAPYQGLLGRDVLNHCVLVYDGPGHQCSLTF